MTVIESNPRDDADVGTGTLTIDLGAVADNYGRLRQELNGVACGACVKADAYGLGVVPVAKTLWQAGCRDFFVAHLGEGIELRRTLPDAAIHVFAGLSSGAPETYRANNLIPVLNSLDDVAAWRSFGQACGSQLLCDLHVDTGMSRLGLDQTETAQVVADPAVIEGLCLDVVMSHLASADIKDSDQSNRQRDEFLAVLPLIRSLYPCARASLANSSGIFRGADFHFDLARPGAALYGVNPTPGETSPIRQVINLEGKILQVRLVDTPRTVGYGASYSATGPTRLATVGAGYADGYLRSLSNSGTAWFNDVEVPVVGRVSMDMITIDISSADPNAARVGASVNLIGPKRDIDDAAREAGTIAYEILTSLGHRYRRVYMNAPAQGGAK
ncbi:MAG: alanine racemase [Rhodospirillales bacterium]